MSASKPNLYAAANGNQQDEDNKKSRSLSDQPHRVLGVKFLQNTSVYIISLALAFFMYHLDKNDFFGKLRLQTRECYATTKTFINQQRDYLLEQSEAKEWIPQGDNLMILIGTLLMVSILALIKQLQLRALAKRIQRQMEIEEEQRRQEEEAAALQSEDNLSMKSDFDTDQTCKCQRITEEEFEFQAKVLTKESIRHLVSSDAYERVMAVKGNDPANWNWQLHDKQEGYFPTNEEDKFEGAGASERAIDDFELHKQIAKVDEDLKKEARANNYAILKAVTGVFDYRPAATIAEANAATRRRTHRNQ